MMRSKVQSRETVHNMMEQISFMLTFYETQLLIGIVSSLHFKHSAQQTLPYRARARHCFMLDPVMPRKLSISSSLALRIVSS